jgi:hypothetical protein
MPRDAVFAYQVITALNALGLIELKPVELRPDPPTAEAR